jgi:hypothetical protein
MEPQKKKAPKVVEVPDIMKSQKKKAPETVEVPDSIAELLHAYKRGDKLTEEQEQELFGFLADQDDVLNLVMAPPFSYTKRNYNRLMKEMGRREYGAVPKVPRPEAELPRLEAKDYRAFIASLWSEAKDIGTITVQKWYQRAGELGFFDETTGKVNLRAFVEEAISFYVEHGRKIAELEQEALSNKALAAMLAEAVSKLTQTITLVDAQIDYLEASYPKLKWQLIPLRVLTNIERYKQREVS